MQLISSFFGHRHQEQQEQGVLAALGAELSSFIYLQLDMINQLEQKERPLISFFPDRAILSSNAHRVGNTSARAFGMLSTYYARLDVLASDLVSGDVDDKDGLIRLRRSIGHGSLIRAGINEISQGKQNVRLSQLEDGIFDKAIVGYTKREQVLLRVCRDEWLDYVSKSDRT